MTTVAIAIRWTEDWLKASAVNHTSVTDHISWTYTVSAECFHRDQGPYHANLHNQLYVTCANNRPSIIWLTRIHKQYVNMDCNHPNIRRRHPTHCKIYTREIKSNLIWYCGAVIASPTPYRNTTMPYCPVWLSKNGLQGTCRILGIILV